jgi:hypothetical protein
VLFIGDCGQQSPVHDFGGIRIGQFFVLQQLTEQSEFVRHDFVSTFYY